MPQPRLWRGALTRGSPLGSLRGSSLQDRNASIEQDYLDGFSAMREATGPVSSVSVPEKCKHEVYWKSEAVTAIVLCKSIYLQSYRRVIHRTESGECLEQPDDDVSSDSRNHFFHQALIAWFERLWRDKRGRDAHPSAKKDSQRLEVRWRIIISQRTLTTR